MNPVAYRASIINILGNCFLFVIKLIAALLSGSIALLSDAFNSLTDIVSSIAIYVCVKISNREADEGHPFGHSRAEPIAGLVVAILAGILGFEIMRTSVLRFFEGGDVKTSAFIIAIPLITIVVKLVMAYYFKRVGRDIHSPAITASGVDSLMDVFVSAAALTGLVGVMLGLPWLDPVAGLIISFWIIYTGYSIGVDNIDYLMGKAPEAELMEEIKNAALGVKGVQDINTVRAHYVGPFIHVEIHVEVAKYLSTFDAHEISDAVEDALSALSAIEKAFVHIDPV